MNNYGAPLLGSFTTYFVALPHITNARSQRYKIHACHMIPCLQIHTADPYQMQCQKSGACIQVQATGRSQRLAAYLHTCRILEDGGAEEEQGAQYPHTMREVPLQL